MGRKFTILKWKCLLELIGHEQNCLFSDVVMGTWSPTSQSSTTLGDSWTKLEMLLNSWQLVIPKQKPFGLMNPCPLPNHQPHFGSLPIADLKCADSEMAQPKIRNFKCLFFLSEIQKNSGFFPNNSGIKKKPNGCFTRPWWVVTSSFQPKNMHNGDELKESLSGKHGSGKYTMYSKIATSEKNTWRRANFQCYSLILRHSLFWWRVRQSSSLNSVFTGWFSKHCLPKFMFEPLRRVSFLSEVQMFQKKFSTCKMHPKGHSKKRVLHLCINI